MANTDFKSALSALWRVTQGDSRVVVAILDGPVYVAHPCFKGTNFRCQDDSPLSATGSATRHATFIASVIAARHGNDPLRGVAPLCSFLLVPIFSEIDDTTLAHCSQENLAHAIRRAAEGGAHVINVSAGQRLLAEEKVEPILADVVRECESRGILIVAATGNDGLKCRNLPAVLPTVLAVGAMDERGSTLPSSNWGAAFRSHGVVAIGENVLGALPPSGVCRRSGTSVSTALVSGAAALLLSAARVNGMNIVPSRVRDAMLASAAQRRTDAIEDGGRQLAGRLDLAAAAKWLFKEGVGVVSDRSYDGGSADSSNPPIASDPPRSKPAAKAIQPHSEEGGCGCGCSGHGKGGGGEEHACSCGGTAPAGRPELRRAYAGGSDDLRRAFAFGRLGYDFESEAARDSFNMSGDEEFLTDPPSRLAEHLRIEGNLPRAESVIWTVEADNRVPICAIQPRGPFSSLTYERLVEFLYEQEVSVLFEEGMAGAAEPVAVTPIPDAPGEKPADVSPSADADRTTESPKPATSMPAEEAEKLSMVGIPGLIIGQVRLARAGRVVPIIQPDLNGMRNMNNARLLDAAISAVPLRTNRTLRQDPKDLGDLGKQALNTLFELHRGLAVASGDRARAYLTIDFAPLLARLDDPAFKGKALEDVSAQPSANVPTGRDLQDVTFSFFDPSDSDRATVNLTLTVDVTAVNPFLAVGSRPLRYSRGPLRR